MKIVPIFLLCIVLLNGCIDDAPRDNPLDPQSSSHVKTGSMTGRILIANISVGIADATITSKTENISVQTDALGYFTFPLLSTGVRTFICSKMNFTTDTFSVTIQAGQIAEIFRGMNGAPVTTFKQIVTRKIDKYFPGPEYYVELSAAVTDPNGSGELDSVWFGVDVLRILLPRPSSPEKFSVIIPQYKIPTNTIEYLAGRKLYIISKDTNHAVNISEAFYVSRIIENTATPLTPSSLSDLTVDSLIIFKWTSPSVQFYYTCSVSLVWIYADQPIPRWTKSNIDLLDEQIQYPTDGTAPVLDPGNYVWSVSVVDQFGNYSRSKEFSFVIKP